MKDKKIEADLKQLFGHLHPYMKGKTWSIVITPEGEISMNYLQPVNIEVKKPLGPVIATEQQINFLVDLIRHSKMDPDLVQEFSQAIRQGRLKFTQVKNLIQKCKLHLETLGNGRNGRRTNPNATKLFISGEKQ